MFRRRKQILSREQSLAAKPIRNENLAVSRDDDGNVVLTITRKKNWWANLLAKMLHMPDKKKVALDEIGTAVWDKCDGKHTVEAIISDFAQKYKLNRREAELSMFAYLRELTRRGFIGLLVDGQHAEKSPVTAKKSKGKRRK